MRVAREEHEGNAARRQDGADRETRPPVEVDVQDRAVQRALARHVHGAFQPPNRTHRLEAALAQELGHDVGNQQVVVADEYAAPYHARSSHRIGLPHTVQHGTSHKRVTRAFGHQPKSAALAAVGRTDRPPKWIKPQLTRLVGEAPSGDGWLHEIKYDGYRMHARIDGRDIKLLTRTGLDWSHRYRRTIEALGSLKVKSAYLDGELCALNGDGVPVFQPRMDEGRTDQLVFFAFDLLFLNGVSTAQLPLIKRKERLQRLFKKEISGCGTANTLPVTVLASGRKPASWAWRASSPSRLIGPTRRATAGSGSSRSASTAKSS